MSFGQEVNAGKASQEMGMVTSTVLGWPCSISRWRHIVIAWSEIKCKKHLDIQKVEGFMSSILAQQASHSLATQDRIYGIDHSSIGGVSEETILVYLEASMELQKVFCIPTGGTGLPYWKATMACFVPDAANVVKGSESVMIPVATLNKISQTMETLASKVTTLMDTVATMRQPFDGPSPILKRVTFASGSPARPYTKARTPVYYHSQFD